MDTIAIYWWPEELPQACDGCPFLLTHEVDKQKCFCIAFGIDPSSSSRLGLEDSLQPLGENIFGLE